MHDLYDRDARADERWLAPHPREFALLWHLAGKKGERVSRGELLNKVWRLRHKPETEARGGFRFALMKPQYQWWTGDRRLRQAVGA